MFISPQLLHYAPDNKPFFKPNHIAELKFDGIRLIVSNMDQLKLYTRHNNDVTTKFPELHNPPIPQGTILDGELIVTDSQGKPDFEAMMQRFTSKSDKTPVTFCAFDIIYYKGICVADLPLHRRKELLLQAIQPNNHYIITQPVNGSPTDYFEAVSAQGLEGIVIKDGYSKYQVNTRSYSWQKVINWTYHDVFISGIRKDDFGWLTSVVGLDGKLRPAGIVELGVTPDHKKAFSSVINKIKVKEDKKFVHLEPVFRAKVKTRNWTKKGMLRSPVFVEFII